LVAGDRHLTRVNANPYVEAPAVFGPHEPQVAGSRPGGPTCANMTAAPSCAAQLAISGDVGARFNVYRDGVLAAAGLPAGAWTDGAPHPHACYSVEAVFPSSGNRSHHSAPWCPDGGQLVPVTDPRVDSSIAPSAPDARFDAARISGWGQPADRFAVRDLKVDRDGRYAVQIQYHNAANQINLGISGGVKWLTVRDAGGAAVAQGVVQLPHAKVAKAHTPLVFSTPLTAALRANAAYRVELGDFYNMSYLQANSTFSAAGGTAGPSNQFDIAGVRVRAVEQP